MFKMNCDRNCAMIALGGGVVGDLVGYVAATFMRGISFVQVPTTMLAMVDSSVGGKTAIDTPSGKNLVGAFHQPKLVYMDLSTLKTLPPRQLSNGLCEAIKMAACLDKTFFEFLEANVDDALALDYDTTSRIVQRSVELKRDVVVEDEKERGLRAVLNWGHTIGHAVEHIMQPDMLHGECVAVGIVKEVEIARALDLCSSATHGRVVRVLKAYRLPTRLPSRVETKDALNYMRFDKKNTSGKIKMILLKSFGDVLSRPSYAHVVEPSLIARVVCPSVIVVPPFDFCQDKICGESSGIEILVQSCASDGRSCDRYDTSDGIASLDDTQVMMRALELLGASFVWEQDARILKVQGVGGKFRFPEKELYLSNAGT